jgi:phosphatidylserine decarboxylase
MIAASGHYEPVAREAYPYAGLPFVGACVAWGIGFPLISPLLLITTVVILLFFRNPDRTPSDPSEDTLVSPADGRVVRVAEASPPEHPELPPLRCVSVFMSLLDVHVNRSPVTGVVRSVAPRSGQFLDARNARSSTVNARNSILFDACGDLILLVQVAGFIARRISCWIGPGDALSRGDRIGVVHFGSRVDLYLPPSYTPLVSVGDKVRAGETPIARRPPSPSRAHDNPPPSEALT